MSVPKKLINDLFLTVAGSIASVQVVEPTANSPIGMEVGNGIVGNRLSHIRLE